MHPWHDCERSDNIRPITTNVGGAVGDGDLIGREVELDLIQQGLTESKGVVLVGDRRVGNTNLISKVSKDLRAAGHDVISFSAETTELDIFVTRLEGELGNLSWFKREQKNWAISFAATKAGVTVTRTPLKGKERPATGEPERSADEWDFRTSEDLQALMMEWVAPQTSLPSQRLVGAIVLAALDDDYAEVPLAVSALWLDADLGATSVDDLVAKLDVALGALDSEAKAIAQYVAACWQATTSRQEAVQRLERIDVSSVPKQLDLPVLTKIADWSGQTIDIITIREQVVADRERILGVDHVDTLTGWMVLSLFRVQQGLVPSSHSVAGLSTHELVRRVATDSDARAFAALPPEVRKLISDGV